MNVTDGSVDVFDSSVDNLSADAVVTPIAPLPVVIPSSATIGPAGGSIRSSDGRLTLRIPAGALSQPVALSFQSATADAPQAVGSGYQIIPPGVSFEKPALLALAYGAADTEGSSAEALTLAVNEGTGWFALGRGSIDPARHTLAVPLDSTAPAPPASAARVRSTRSPLAPGPDYFYVIRGWQFSPNNNRVILTGTRVPLAVTFVGYSSPLIPFNVLLSDSPSEVEVSWWVNGNELGTPVDGVVTPTSSTEGIYIAPDCPPSGNPVTVSAVIANTGIFAPSFKPKGFAKLRIVPRTWRLRLLVGEFQFGCGPSSVALSDDVLFNTAPFDLTLDDTGYAQATFQAAPGSHRVAVCPSFCGGNKAGLPAVGTVDSMLNVTVTAQLSAAFDGPSRSEPDFIDFKVDGTYGGLSGTKVSCTTPDGSTAVVPISALAVSFYFYSDEFRLKDGEDNVRNPANFFGNGSLTFKYHLMSMCAP